MKKKKKYKSRRYKVTFKCLHCDAYHGYAYSEYGLLIGNKSINGNFKFKELQNFDISFKYNPESNVPQYKNINERVIVHKSK